VKVGTPEVKAHFDALRADVKHASSKKFPIGLHVIYLEQGSLVLSLAGPKKWFAILFGTEDNKDEHVAEFLSTNSLSKCGLHLEKFAAVISTWGYTLASFFDVNKQPPHSLNPKLSWELYDKFAKDTEIKKEQVLPSHVFAACRKVSHITETVLAGSLIEARLAQILGKKKNTFEQERRMGWPQVEKYYKDFQEFLVDMAVNSVQAQLMSPEGIEVDFSRIFGNLPSIA
jgi:hypothetical protein